MLPAAKTFNIFILQIKSLCSETEYHKAGQALGGLNSILI